MTGFKRIFRAAAMTGLLAGAVSGVSAQEVKLKFHHFSSPHGWDGKVMVGRVVELIEQGSKGRIDVTVFPGMQLGGKPSALVDQVTDGVVDLIYTLPGYTAGRFPILAGLELPFLGAAGAEVTTRLAWDFYDAYARGEFKDYRPVSISMTDTGLLHTTKKKIAAIDDLRGLKIRVASRYIGMTVKELGAVPVQMPLPAVYEALARGQVQGMMIPWLIMKPFKLHDVTRHHLEIPIYHSTLLQLIGEKSYRKLPAELKAVIDGASGRELSNWIAVRQDRVGMESREYGLKRGADISQLSGAALDVWIARASTAHDLWAKEMDRRGHNGAEMLAFLKKTAAKHQAMKK